MSKLGIKLVILLTVTLVHTAEWKFPNDFKFGVATASYQIEGGWNEDGKGPSVWDDITHNRSHTIDNADTGDIACDSYHKLDEDIRMIKNLGVNFYRFSLAWSRILPNGIANRVNPAGLKYYNDLIDKLLENNVEPMVTLFHWDTPKKYSVLGGWTNPMIIQQFANYARIVFESFGDRVKTWITINEPKVHCAGFKGSIDDPELDAPLGMLEYLCIHNVLKAHAEAYHIYDKEFRWKQKGRISISMEMSWTEAENKSNVADVQASEQLTQFLIGHYTHPIFKFDYPEIVKKRIAERSRLENFTESRLPQFTLAEKLKIKGTFDFLGINHYVTMYGRAVPEPPIGLPSIHIDAGGKRYNHSSWIGGAADWSWVTPWGLRNLLKWVKKEYNNPEIIITENGYADEGDDLNDEARINYYRLYLNATLQAIIEDGVRVKAYTAWSLMDNFEWIKGYRLRFGLYHVNFTDPARTRTAKKSVGYFKNVIATKTIT